jgi:hypothetical protein
MIKKTILTALLFLTFSCETMPKSWNWGIKPRPFSGIRNFPPSDSEYGQGFKDGCGSGFDVAAKGLLADFNERKYDYKRTIKSPDYDKGWFDGLEQCTYIIDWEVT